MTDLEEGITALKNKDYDLARRKFEPLAADGHAEANYYLGGMCWEGQGLLKKDFKEAAKYYERAAEKGHAMAQYTMSRMYYTPRGVLQNHVIAHMWANISIANGYALGNKLINLIEESMTNEQIAEAQKMAQDWLDKHSKPEPAPTIH